MAKKKREKVAKGINFLPEQEIYEVQVSMRHPITRQSRNLRRIRDYDGKPITSLAQAKAMMPHLRRQLEEHVKDNPLPTWEEVVYKFLEWLRLDGKVHETIRNYELSLAKHTFKRWEGKKINQITPTMIRELFLDNRQVWSDHHRKSMRKHVKAVFEYALDAELIPKNPMPKITCKTGQKLKAVLTEKQIIKLLQLAKEKNFVLKEHVFLSVRLGLRPGELRFLKWEHIDYDNKLIFIKGSVTRSGIEKETKTGDDRVLPMTSSMESFLRRLQLSTGAANYVVPQVEVWTKHEQSRTLKNFLREIGLPTIRYYDLRASWCTLLLAKGVPPAKAMQLGGWKKLSTMDYYLRLAGVYVKDGLDCLDHLCFEHQEAEIVPMRAEKGALSLTTS